MQFSSSWGGASRFFRLPKRCLQKAAAAKPASGLEFVEQGLLRRMKARLEKICRLEGTGCLCLGRRVYNRLCDAQNLKRARNRARPERKGHVPPKEKRCCAKLQVTRGIARRMPVPFCCAALGVAGQKRVSCTYAGAFPIGSIDGKGVCFVKYGLRIRRQSTTIGAALQIEPIKENSYA